MRAWAPRAALAVLVVGLVALVVATALRNRSPDTSVAAPAPADDAAGGDDRHGSGTGDADSAEPDDSPEGRLVAAALAGDAAGVAALLAQGVSPQAKDREGRGALHRAAESGSVETLELLIEAGAEVDGLDGQGFTPLVAAALAGALPTGLRLLALGADVDGQREPHFVTALEQAMAGWHAVDGTGALGENRRRFVEALFEAGADPNLGSVHFGPPIRFLPWFVEDEAMVNMFFDHGARLDDTPQLWVFERRPGPIGERIAEAVRAARQRASEP